MNTIMPSSTGNSLLENYVSVLKKYNDFNGRARRSEYWQFVLINVAITQVLNITNIMLFNGFALIAWVVLLFNLAILLPTIAVAIRRMHDVGKSGWFVLVPIYNFILAVTEGERSSNQYGNDPKAKTAQMA